MFYNQFLRRYPYVDDVVFVHQRFKFCYDLAGSVYKKKYSKEYDNETVAFLIAKGLFFELVWNYRHRRLEVAGMGPNCKLDLHGPHHDRNNFENAMGLLDKDEIMTELMTTAANVDFAMGVISEALSYSGVYAEI